MLWYSIECVHPMNRFDFLEHVQHFDAHDFNQEMEKEKKKNNILLASFQNTCNITKHFEKLTIAF